MRWDQIGFMLATHGIPSDVDEDVAEDYKFDPWRPAPVEDVIRITVALKDADKLAGLIRSWQEVNRGTTEEQ